MIQITHYPVRILLTHSCLVVWRYTSGDVEATSCSYERGSPDFRKGDDVRIIHPKDLEDDAGYGYIVGLREAECVRLQSGIESGQLDT